ncbi:MAG: CrcB family protein [Staphylococcus epidermidis]|nr:CrcB family protein [Staphylococcus epidermidis]
MITILLVMLGGGIGAVFRALITNICQSLFNSKIPIGTSIVNITGSLIIGFMMVHALASQDMFPFFVTGVLGGLTTFSTLSSELVNMLSPQFKLSLLASVDTISNIKITFTYGYSNLFHRL